MGEQQFQQREFQRSKSNNQIILATKLNPTMKLISINAILIGTSSLSIAIKAFIETSYYPPISLFILSIIEVFLILILEYQHRQFQRQQINLAESTSLFQYYLLLFAFGLTVVIFHKTTNISPKWYVQQYLFLGKSIYYSMIYYCCNYFLGLSYLYLFKKAYLDANKNKIPFSIVDQIKQQRCPVCLNRIVIGQKIAKISCNHIFHLYCLNKWIKCRPQCPLCYNNINVCNQ